MEKGQGGQSKKEGGGGEGEGVEKGQGGQSKKEGGGER